MEDERVISFERGKQLAEQLGIEFFETSAKENIHVKVSGRFLSDIDEHHCPLTLIPISVTPLTPHFRP